MVIETPELRLGQFTDTWDDEFENDWVCKSKLQKYFNIDRSDTIVVCISDKYIRGAIKSAVSTEQLTCKMEDMYCREFTRIPKNVWWWVEIVEEKMVVETPELRLLKLPRFHTGMWYEESQWGGSKSEWVCDGPVRKKWNVRDCDTIVVLVSNKPVGGAIHAIVDAEDLFYTMKDMYYEKFKCIPEDVWWWVEIVK